MKHELWNGKLPDTYMISADYSWVTYTPWYSQTRAAAEMLSGLDSLEGYHLGVF